MIHNITRWQQSRFVFDATTAALHFTSCHQFITSPVQPEGRILSALKNAIEDGVETQDNSCLAESDALEPCEPRLTAPPRLGEGHYWAQKYAPQVEYYRNEHRCTQRVNSYPGQVPLLIFLINPWKHREADDEVYCVEQWTNFVHYIPINEFIIREICNG